MSRKKSIYERYIKRGLDFFLSSVLLILLSPVYLLLYILVRSKLGSPVLFRQKRPGYQEHIFTMYKYRSMTDETDEYGNLLSDEVRLTEFGRKLRDTSLDELPELINIFKGDMSFVGPRPQLVRDMVFMSEEQRKRHSVRPGLTGLAQVNGRNAITWEKKLAYDLDYIKDVSFINDMKIFFQTIRTVFVHEGISMEGMATALDLGDDLLQRGAITREYYDQKQEEARRLLDNSK